MTGIEMLDGIRDKALSLPVSHPLRKRYRENRRACANVAEDCRVKGGTNANVDSIYKSIQQLVQAVDALIIP